MRDLRTRPVPAGVNRLSLQSNEVDNRDRQVISLLELVLVNFNSTGKITCFLFIFIVLF